MYFLNNAHLDSHISCIIYRVSYRIFWWGGGRSLWGSVCGRARTRSTHMLACVQARGSGGMPPQEQFFFRSSQIASHAI